MKVVVGSVLAGIMGLTGGAVEIQPAVAEAGLISGAAFQDQNRNALREAGESPFAGQQLYLFDGTGTRYLGTTLTDDQGRYSFAGLMDGEYLVELEGASWSAIRREWVPTTGSIRPTKAVTLEGSAVVDFAWRPIARSTIFGSPISSFVGSNGLRVDSYDDVVSARELFDRVMLGLVGQEAQSVKIHFDFGSAGDTTSTATSIGQDGRYESYGADVYASYMSWLDGADTHLVHEYGHAWSLYHAHLTQQDPTLASYLEFRGLSEDPRLGSTHAWSPREMIAEDYRQLLGSPTARLASQENNAIPAAASVPGLEDFLRNTFTSSTTSPPPPVTPLAVSALSVNPDPVRSSGQISWSVTVDTTVTVTVVNSKGAVVRTLLADASKQAGSTVVTWDRTSDGGRRVGKGTYVVRVIATGSDGLSATATREFKVA